MRARKKKGGSKKKTIEGTACLVRNEKGALFFLCPLKLTLRLAWRQREENVSLVKGKACAGGVSLSGVGCECGVFFHSIDRPRERESERAQRVENFSTKKMGVRLTPPLLRETREREQERKVRE